MIEYAQYYNKLLEKWDRIAILQFDGDYAVVRNQSGRYLRIPISELQAL